MLSTVASQQKTINAMGRVADLYESERLVTMVADAALIGLYYQSLLSHWSVYVYFPKIVFRDGVF